MANSLFLKKFLNNVGNSINALNTTCIGISGVSSGKIEKPDSLHISWDPKDCKLVCDTSKIYIIKSAYVFLAEATIEYFDSIKYIYLLNQTEFNEFNNSSKAKKILIISEKINFDLFDYDNIEISNKIRTKDEIKLRVILAQLLIHYRNKIIHSDSKADLSLENREYLLSQKVFLQKNHCGLKPEDLLQHFDEGKCTLKDVSSIASNIVILVRIIDYIFQKNITCENLDKLIKNTEIETNVQKILKSKKDLREKKLNHLLEVSFHYVNVKIRSDYVQKRLNESEKDDKYK